MTTKGTTPSSTSGSRSARGYVLIKRDHLAIVIGLEHERWKRAHPEVCRKTGIT
jgi:hypothetical protein